MSGLVHRRLMSFSSEVVDDHLEVVATIEDQQPWAPDYDRPSPVHHMELVVHLDLAERTITAARARMIAWPHAECPAIEAAYASLVGLQIGPGFSREVRKRVGGIAGCAHISELTRALGPALIQALSAEWIKRSLDNGTFETAEAPWSVGTCHVWAEGGPGMRKFAAGWRPGARTIPVPLAETFETTGPTSADPAERSTRR